MSSLSVSLRWRTGGSAAGRRTGRGIRRTGRPKLGGKASATKREGAQTSSKPRATAIHASGNHGAFSIDGRYPIFTCEYQGGLAKIDFVNRHVLGFLKLSKGEMPQDIRISRDGKVFYVADMHADGVFLVDGDAFKEVGFISTGIGAHGLYRSRDGKKLYVANRGTHKLHGSPHGHGSIAVIDFATRRVDTVWQFPNEGCEQGSCAVALVIVRHGGAPAGL